jgi:hypothetical protein
MRYVLDFGSANAGSSPAFVQFKNADTLVEVGDGLFYFDYPWASPSITSIAYKASVNGVELSDTIRATAAISSGSVTAGGGAAVNPWIWTAGQILNMAAIELGLAESADPYASTDASVVQLRTLLKSAGMEISQHRDWKVLEKEATITGDGTTTAFSLPADFLRMKDGTGWSRTATLPLSLVGSQAWQALRARSVSGTVTVHYRIQQGQMVFFEAPALAATLAYEYLSRYWVASDGSASSDAFFPSATGDKVLLEPLMVTRLVKAKWLQAKGFDSTGAFAEYQQALSDAGNLEPAATLSLNGGGCGDRLVDGMNWPSRLG